ncbi:MAG TPA: hypothetical protein VFM45_12365, partial [Anaeromyxobacteraceae bacterium]|nr:hypothetical protein [Anaeromyxobacteraceae bacterium]
MAARKPSSTGDLFASLEPAPPRLQVTAKDLVAALKLVKKFAGGEKKAGHAFLGFDGESLLIGVSGVTHRAPATGDWSGTARVPAAFVMRFARIEPTDDPVVLTLADSRLTVRSASWTYDI